MEQIHRNTIINNIDKLIELTEYKLLMEKCESARLISHMMARNIESDTNSDDTRHRDLLKKITQRGPTAFTTFKAICETDFTEAAEILKQLVAEQNGNRFLSIKDSKKENDRNVRQMFEGKSLSKLKPGTSKESTDSTKSEMIRLEPYKGPITRELNVKKATKFCEATRPDIATYSLRGRHRGVLFLVNIIDFHAIDKRRNGAEVDKDRLLNLFDEMGFTLFYYENINSDQFNSLIKQLSSAQTLRTADCLVFGLLTHGSLVGQTTYVEFGDGLYFATEKIVQEFSNSNCKYMQGKPKIFLFPFCRGDESDQGVTIYRQRKVEHDSSGHDFVQERIPTYSDIAICYATVPGFMTHRDPEDGSWYIQGLCRVFAEHAHDATFEDLMKYLESEVGTRYTSSGSSQTSSVEYRGFSKVLYFNPGYFGEIETNANETTTNNISDNTPSVITTE